jgi:hypothetical protein
MKILSIINYIAMSKIYEIAKNKIVNMGISLPLSQTNLIDRQRIYQSLKQSCALVTKEHFNSEKIKEQKFLEYLIKNKILK